MSNTTTTIQADPVSVTKFRSAAEYYLVLRVIGHLAGKVY